MFWNQKDRFRFVGRRNAFIPRDQHHVFAQDHFRPSPTITK
jgi:hypothetical protein